MSQLPDDYVSLNGAAPAAVTDPTVQLPDDYVSIAGAAAPPLQSTAANNSNPSFLPNYNAVMDKINNRPSMIADLIKDPSTLARFQQHPLGTTLRTIGGAMQYAEGVPAAIGLAAQSGKYGQLPDMLSKLAQGQASPQLGDLIRTTGFGGAINEPLASTTGFLATLGATPAAKTIQPASNALAYNAMKEYIPQAARDFTFDHDGARGLLNEGLVFANAKQGYQAAQTRTGEIGKMIDNVIKSSPNATLATDQSAVLKPLDDAIAQANLSPNTNKTLADRLMAAKLDLSNKYSPQGNIIGPKDLNMTPPQLFQLKKQVSDLTKWTGNMSDDKPVNAALQDVYRNIKTSLNSQVPGLSELNQRYGDMLTATKSLQKSSEAHFGLKDTAKTIEQLGESTILGHFLGPQAGVALQGALMAGRTGAAKSVLSKLLYSAPKS